MSTAFGAGLFAVSCLVLYFALRGRGGKNGTVKRPAAQIRRSPVNQRLLDVKAAGVSHIGGRKNNEDRYLIQGDLFLVADGMGGQSCGEKAADVAVRAFRQSGQQSSHGSDWFAVAMALGWEGMKDLVANDRRCGTDSGTTVTAVRRFANLLRVGWAGDSPLYRLRGGKLEELTVPHTIAEMLVAHKHLRREDVPNSPFRNKLYNFLHGQKKPTEYQEIEVEIEAGDVYLLCTDGLVGYSKMDVVQGILNGEGTCEEKVAALLAHALASKTRDNATGIVLVVQ